MGGEERASSALRSSSSTIERSHQLEPSGSPISDSALRGQYMMFKQESGVCGDLT